MHPTTENGTVAIRIGRYWEKDDGACVRVIRDSDATVPASARHPSRSAAQGGGAGSPNETIRGR